MRKAAATLHRVHFVWFRYLRTIRILTPPGFSPHSHKSFVALVLTSPANTETVTETLSKKLDRLLESHAQVASPPCQTVFESSKAAAATHKRSHVHKLHPAKVRRLSLRLHSG
ncbi:uncharacterized protein V6R79_006279 [Siganus canaliculatus]